MPGAQCGTWVRRQRRARKLLCQSMTDHVKAAPVRPRDVVLALALAALCLISPLAAGFGVLDAALLACAVAAPFGRRRFTWGTIGACVAVLAVCAFAESLPTGTIGVAMFTAYVVARHLSAPARYIAAAALLAGDIAATSFIAPALRSLPLTERAQYIAWSVTLLTVAFLVGELRRRAEEAAAKEVQIQLERQRKEFEREAAEQRAHLAREIHDIVTHSLTVIVAQADGARYGASPDDALRTISSVGRESLRQMRGVVGLLRGGEQRPVAPLVDSLDIDGLVATSRAGGLDIDYSIDGTPPALDPGTTLTIHRIVQEALTNAMKHGDGTAQLTVSWRPDEVALRLENGVAHEPAHQHGHGLRGMRERASLIDGTLTSSPVDHHTWVTEARLPLQRTDRVEP